MKKQKESTILRQLIRIGVFSALWIVISFLLAFTIAFLPPVLLVLPLLLGLVGSSCALLGLALGEYIPFVFMRDAWTVMLAGDSSGTAPVAEWCMSVVNTPVMLLLCAATVLMTCLGCLWGQKIVNQHFKKTGASAQGER